MENKVIRVLGEQIEKLKKENEILREALDESLEAISKSNDYLKESGINWIGSNSIMHLALNRAFLKIIESLRKVGEL
jgi:hypothetical protein